MCVNSMQKPMRGFAFWMSALMKSSTASSTISTTTHLLRYSLMLMRYSTLSNADPKTLSDCILCLSIQILLFDRCLKLILLTWFFIYVLRYIRRGKPDAGFSLFQSECLKWSGYVEFDNLKKNVLTYLAENRYLPRSLIFLFHLYC